MTDGDGRLPPIGIEKQYDFLTERIANLADHTEDGAKLFLSLFSAILAGSIWLRLQTRPPIPTAYLVLSDLLVALLTALCIFMTLYNLQEWWEYRNDLARITANSTYPALPPTWKSACVELGLCAAMLAACVLYMVFNPFAQMPNQPNPGAVQSEQPIRDSSTRQPVLRDDSHNGRKLLTLRITNTDFQYRPGSTSQ